MEKTLKLTKVKRMVLAVLTVSFLLGVPITSYAASYTLKTLRCPKCGSYNKSYGYDENYGSYTVSVPSNGTRRRISYLLLYYRFVLFLM